MKEKRESCQVVTEKKKKKKEQAAARSWHVCFYLYKSVTLDLW